MTAGLQPRRHHGRIISVRFPGFCEITGTLRFRLTLLLAAGLIQPLSGEAANPALAEGVSIAQLSDQLFRSVEGFWTAQVQALGGRYRPAHLSLFSCPFRQRCDVQAALSGRFYCPINEVVYMDQPFLQRLARRAEGGANLAAGFVMAHEVAHHVQNIIGTTTIVERARAGSTAQVASRSLTAFELQADCYAGLWVHWAAGQHTVTVPAGRVYKVSRAH